MGNKGSQVEQLNPISSLKAADFVPQGFYVSRRGSSAEFRYAWRFKLQQEPHVVIIDSAFGVENPTEPYVNGVKEKRYSGSTYHQSDGFPFGLGPKNNSLDILVQGVKVSIKPLRPGFSLEVETQSGPVPFCESDFWAKPPVSSESQSYMTKEGLTVSGVFSAEDGMITGPGRIGYHDGSVYEGDLVANQREGTGTYTAGVTGSVFLSTEFAKAWKWLQTSYEGEWKRDLPHGQGVVKSPIAHATYEGGWKKGIPHGAGIVVHDHDHETYTDAVFHYGEIKGFQSSTRWSKFRTQFPRVSPPAEMHDQNEIFLFSTQATRDQIVEGKAIKFKQVIYSQVAYFEDAIIQSPAELGSQVINFSRGQIN